MIDAVTEIDSIRHAEFAPGQFPARWHDAAYELHRRAWATEWEGRLTREHFIAQLASDHTDVLYEPNGRSKEDTLLAYIKWKATERFHLSRDQLSDPSQPSMLWTHPTGYVCAYEITAASSHSWRGLGRRLLSDTVKHWEQSHGEAVFCTYSPKRMLTATLRKLAASDQAGRPALEAFAHRASAAASRHIDEWVTRLGRPLEEFIENEIVPIPDQWIMEHLAVLSEHHGREIIDGIVGAIGIAYNFVFRASSGLPACGPASFHRALGAEHWRQYPASASNCADALGLVDHWRYSHDPARREKCAAHFKEQCTTRAQPTASPDELIVLA